MTTLQDCIDRDTQDPLRSLRTLFNIPAGTIYLDGNSLGALPAATPARVADVVAREWGTDLIQSWNKNSWFALPQQVGNKIARLIGAGHNDVVAVDSTSINLYKVLSVALNLAAVDSPTRQQLVSERSNFPTDLYIAEALCQQHGMELRLVEPEDIAAALTPDLAVLMLTHVNYRTGAMHDMKALTQAAHAVGALVVWDLAHSAGAVPVNLTEAGADFAVGCGYKYLNGGPGAPAFVWANPQHSQRIDLTNDLPNGPPNALTFAQPLAGWWGHAAPFAFTPNYQAAPGITRYQCGTQPIISLAALDCGLDVFAAAEALGGMAALRHKSLALTDLFIELVETRCPGHDLGLATPREHARRGSQICLTREYGPHAPPLRPEGAATALVRPGGGDSGAYAIVQALIARGVVGDFRAGDGGRHKDILRFGFTPLYIGFEEVWHAVEHLRQVLDSGEWQRPEFNRQHAVT